MNLVATRWWSMLFMPSCVLMAGVALGVFLMLRAWQAAGRGAVRVLADDGECGDAVPGEHSVGGMMGGMDAREGLSAGRREDAAGGQGDRGAEGAVHGGRERGDCASAGIARDSSSYPLHQRDALGTRGVPLQGPRIRDRSVPVGFHDPGRGRTPRTSHRDTARARPSSTETTGVQPSSRRVSELSTCRDSNRLS